MDPLNPWPAAAALLLLVGCGWVLGRFERTPPKPGRFDSIDGLRGFLAFFVFLHHASYWYFHVRDGRWGGIDSHLYRHFGESAVMMFFMITAFLFTSKIIDARTRPIDWRRLYVSRVMRLVPLYLFAMAVLFTLVALETGLSLRVPPAQLLRDASIWIGFSVFGQPDLNGLAQTTYRLAGVTWSLPYEWCFYLLLPLFALLLRARAPLAALIPCTLLAAVIASQLGNALACESFLGGIVAAFAVRSRALRAALSGTGGSLLAIACVATAVLLFPSGYSRPVLPLMSIAFVAMACGNTLFGLLLTQPARTIGEMGYSLYLLHGALLTVVFRHVITVDVARTLTPLQHWLVILCCVPVLVGLCSLSYHLIEARGMAAGTRIDAWLKRRAVALSAPVSAT